jgi:hypothetical protein
VVVVVVVVVVVLGWRLTGAAGCNR